MQPSRPWKTLRARTLFGAGALGIIGLVVFATVSGGMSDSREVGALETIPDRFTKVVLHEPPPELPSQFSAEEAQDVSQDPNMRKAQAENAGLEGLLQDLSALESTSGGSDVFDVGKGRGQLRAPKGTQFGSGGLGSQGLGLAAKGRGTGTSSHGAGTSSRASSSTVRALPEVRTGTEHYTEYGVNEMTVTDQDRLSTFAIDVDTASYAVSRSKLNRGRLPPESAVRVEEFVNYFAYEYSGPTDSAPFAVHMEAAPSPWDASRHVLRVGVKGKEYTAGDRKPAHLTFLVDVSGSMSSANKIGLVKQSLHDMVSNLMPQDTVAIATYAGATQVILQPTPVVQASVIIQAIDSLRTGGGTHMSTGMELAYRLASESYVAGAENRVVVLSDGDANIGRTSHTEILDTVKDYSERGITLTTVGFGMGNYKDTMMERLANEGDGNYFYIDSRSEAKKVFGQELAGTIITIAKDVKIQVEFNPEAVYAYRLIGYENRDIADRDFRNDAVNAGEIGSGHRVTALYEVVLTDARDLELATVRLRAKEPGPDSPAREWSTTFEASRLHSEFAAASNDFRLAIGTATFAELLRGSPYVAEVSYSDVWRIVDNAVSATNAQGQELLQLVETAGKLSGQPIQVASR
jgi:Ca-activated chloride channel family protein